jgi:type II secretory pathway pseudopilin PulG
MIVILILGVLAAILIGSVRNASMDARRAGTQDTVRTTQQAIEQFRAYTGRLPNLISSWNTLTTPTTVGSVTVGPFLKSTPRNLVAVHASNPSCITDGNAPILYTDTCTFQYDYAGGAGTGRFIASYEAGP